MGGLLAYLDPGSGSMILQAIVGGVAAVAVASKVLLATVPRLPRHPEEGRLVATKGPGSSAARSATRTATSSPAARCAARARAGRLGGAGGNRAVPRASRPAGSSPPADRGARQPARRARRRERRRGPPPRARSGGLVPVRVAFGMLRDAALLELDLLLAALDEGSCSKDASPVQRAMARLEARLRRRGLVRAAARGRPWAGYRQFCMLVLYPLLLQAHKDVPFQPWLRRDPWRDRAGADAGAPGLPRPLPAGAS